MKHDCADKRELYFNSKLFLLGQRYFVVINKGKLATGFLVENKVLKDKSRNEE